MKNNEQTKLKMLPDFIDFENLTATIKDLKYEVSQINDRKDFAFLPELGSREDWLSLM